VPQKAVRRRFGTVRAKGCGKSAPRSRQRMRHGKPHPEQDRIGTAHGVARVCRPGWLLDIVSNGDTRGMVAHPGPPGGQNPAYRPSGAFTGDINAHFLRQDQRLSVRQPLS
jgi:hypothetical protein